MIIAPPPKRLSAAALILGLVLLPSVASADPQHCPMARGDNSHVVCGKGCDPEADKTRLETLAKDIQKAGAPVCLLAMVDPKDRGYSRKLAIKRVLWVRDTLIEGGVHADSIAVELRLLDPDADKGLLHRVNVILGR